MNTSFKKIDEKPTNKTLSLKQQVQFFFKRKENVVGFSVLATSISLVLVSVFFFRASNFDNRQIALYTQDPTPTPIFSCSSNAQCDRLTEYCFSGKCVKVAYPYCKNTDHCVSYGQVCINSVCVSPTPLPCQTDSQCPSPNKQYCNSGTCVTLAHPACKTDAHCFTAIGEHCVGGTCKLPNPTPTKTQVNNTFSPTPVQYGGNQAQYCDTDAQCSPAYKTYCANHTCVEIAQGYCKTDVHCSYLNNGKCVSGQCQVGQPDGSHTVPTATYAPESNNNSQTTLPTRTPTPAAQSASNKVPTPTTVVGDAGHDNSSNTSGSQQGGSNSNAPANGQAGGEQSPVVNTNPGEATAQHPAENTFVAPTAPPVPVKNPIAKAASSVNKAVDTVAITLARFLVNLFSGK